jgi:hypothetical protein
MECLVCKVAMKCRFTMPILQASRFRTYRCPQCKGYRNTIEFDEVLLPLLPEEVRAIRKAVVEAQATRYKFAKKFAKGAGGPPESGPD